MSFSNFFLLNLEFIFGIAGYCCYYEESVLCLVIKKIKSSTSPFFSLYLALVKSFILFLTLKSRVSSKQKVAVG